MQNPSLSGEEKRILLAAARHSIEDCLKGNTPSPSDISSHALLANRGAFVTLQKDRRLRGCIGTFAADRPVYDIVREMAISAATKDPRFPLLNMEELRQVRIEISVLSPMEIIDDISKIEVGRHGLYIVNGFYKGVLLPQVAVEHNWDREAFLKNTCLKAGLNQDSWKEGADIYIFTADIFGE